MKRADTPETAPLTLRAATARDLMLPNPVSISDQATVLEAAGFFASKGFSAAPVIDASGRPVGVVSQTDIVIHDGETAREKSAPKRPQEEPPATSSDEMTVHDIMTPIVLSVAPDTPARRVVELMLTHNVHRLFVVDRSGVLTGVVSALDVLRRLS